MVERFKVTLPSLTGERERTAYVCLPEVYGEDDRRYPVIYMFDGHNLFTDEEATYGKCWGLEDYLKNTRTPVIIAAVECNHEGDCRLSEYSPVSFDYRDGKRIIGRGKKYMDWLTGEFKPYIDGNYLTLPDRKNTYIAGSSMGGLMTVYALAKYGKFFSKGAALSPSLWVGKGVLPDFIVNAKFRKDTMLFMDYGNIEFKNHESMRESFCEAYSVIVKKGVCVTARVVPDGRHCEASWEKEIPYFMSALGF